MAVIHFTWPIANSHQPRVAVSGSADISLKMTMWVSVSSCVLGVMVKAMTSTGIGNKPSVGYDLLRLRAAKRHYQKPPTDGDKGDDIVDLLSELEKWRHMAQQAHGIIAVLHDPWHRGNEACNEWLVVFVVVVLRVSHSHSHAFSCDDDAGVLWFIHPNTQTPNFWQWSMSCVLLTIWLLASVILLCDSFITLLPSLIPGKKETATSNSATMLGIKVTIAFFLLLTKPSNRDRQGPANSNYLPTTQLQSMTRFLLEFMFTATNGEQHDEMQKRENSLEIHEAGIYRTWFFTVIISTERPALAYPMVPLLVNEWWRCRAAVGTRM